jgi:hypothetical protein
MAVVHFVLNGVVGISAWSTDQPISGGALARWSEPQPVPRGRPPVPPFQDAPLPEALRSWVSDVGARLQCPADFVAVCRRPP